ncbi:phosphoribosylformylglycinamidine synthase [Candidatus Falkowbacteria bacterium]|nr:phosphoribosylformylglycinamidine synthase [Candidatus Falkowbacteria bacterium]
MIRRFYRRERAGFEWCFYVALSAVLTAAQEEALRWLLAETFAPGEFGEQSLLTGEFEGPGRIVEIGPRLNFETPWSSNAVAICHNCGLHQVIRLERSRRYLLPAAVDVTAFVGGHHDRMTEMVYRQPLDSLVIDLQPQSVRIIHVLEHGRAALRQISQELGLGFDEQDVEYYHYLFVELMGRDPTDVELFQLAQMNSEHCRHWFFKGRHIINGQEKPGTLLDLIRSTWQANSGNSVIAFSDNSSAIRALAAVDTLLPRHAGQPSAMQLLSWWLHAVLTAETHNFPSGVAPVPGAETGTGGRLRDNHATGRGAFSCASTAGFITDNLHLPGYRIPGEPDHDVAHPTTLASPLEQQMGMPRGAFDYGNKYGEPNVGGFARTFGLFFPDGERRGAFKPTMFTGGLGWLPDQQTKKAPPAPGMLIIGIGGRAFRIGLGGGSASSMTQGDNRADLDFNAVQRGDPETKQCVWRLIRACVEMGIDNPILNIHDQGAGGPCNVLTELMEPAGGRIDIRQIKLGDQTLSVLEIWGAEYQERYGLLIDPKNLALFQAICEREKVSCEVLGEVTGDGRVVVYDSQTETTPVNLDLRQALTQTPQKTFKDETRPLRLEPLRIPPDLTVREALRSVWQLVAVGSKEWLTHQVDHSVGGLVARAQACGPLGLPVADSAVLAASHFGLTGMATAIGEQPVKGLISPAAGGRMAVAEALLNLAGALISGIRDIKASVNWMWPAKFPGEADRLWQAAEALTTLMKQIGMAADGGKDSLSMAARLDDGTLVKCLGQVVVSAYVTVADIRQVVTPDLKPGDSRLALLEVSPGKQRLGGTALAQALGQLGDDAPDVDNPLLLAQSFQFVQELIRRNLLLACHDVSDGGLITAVAEMVMAGQRGCSLQLSGQQGVFAQLFNEEPQLVLQMAETDYAEVQSLALVYNVALTSIGHTVAAPRLFVTFEGETVLYESLSELLRRWRKTSDRLEAENIGEELAAQQSQHCGQPPSYQLTFTPEPTLPLWLQGNQPRVAVIREEGSNGDREMAAAFHLAGFETWDLTMTDLLARRVTLDQFRGVVFVGGFSYADVLDSAKGWAGVIRFNPQLREMFDRFYDRPDTFSLGVCNGCQLMALLGWVPWKGLPDVQQPRFIHNRSGRFESRLVTVGIDPSPAMMLQGMAGSRLGVWVAHGEGRLHCPDPTLLADITARHLTPLLYCDHQGTATETYPFNPNGSPMGIAGLCSADGRHLAVMPHPERMFQLWQWPYLPPEWQGLPASPWLQMFQNARRWCGE